MDIPEKTLQTMINGASKKQLRTLVTGMLALASTMGVAMYSTTGTLAEQEKVVKESIAADVARTQTLERHDRELRDTSERVESISILLVQQGRYFEDMVRSVAPKGTRLPARPESLVSIEAEILRRRHSRAER